MKSLIFSSVLALICLIQFSTAASKFHNLIFLKNQNCLLLLDKPTRWGIIAAGRISHDFIKSLKNYPLSEHQVVAIASRDLNRAQDYARRFNITRAYGSYAQLANDSQVDVVYIGTINPYHLPVAKMMLMAGKPVLCEKPLTMNKKQTKELIELAERKNLFLMEAVWSRFLPSYVFAMNEIAKGTIGEVLHVDARFTPYLLNVPRLVQKKLGGGTVLDLGGYAANVILLGFNHAKPTEIKAVGVLNEDKVEVAVSASLKFPGGKLGTIMLDIRGNAPSEAMFMGTKGYIRVCYALTIVLLVI